MRVLSRSLCAATAACLLVCTYEEPGPEFVWCDPCKGLTCAEPLLIGDWAPQSAGMAMLMECDSTAILSCRTLSFHSCTYGWLAEDTSGSTVWSSLGYWTARDSMLLVDGRLTVVTPGAQDRSWSTIDDNDSSDPFVDLEPRRYPLGSACSTPSGCDTARASRWIYTLLDSTHLSLRQCCLDSCRNVGVLVKVR